MTDKPAIEKMAEWLKELPDADLPYIRNIIDKAISLAAEEKEKPRKKCNCFDCRGDAKFFEDEPSANAPASLAKEVDDKLAEMSNEGTSLDDTHRLCRRLALEAARIEVENILCRYKSTEDLVDCEMVPKKVLKVLIDTFLQKPTPADLKWAREYLNGLADRGEK